MKKKLSIIFLLMVIVGLTAAVITFNRPYKPTAFVTDGENWSASVNDGSSLILDLNIDSKSKNWSIVSEPETFASDYDSLTENVAEFHIIALDDGEGEMVFQCMEEDGSATRYVLVLSISRHQKKCLQIDSVSFNRCE